MDTQSSSVGLSLTESALRQVKNLLARDPNNSQALRVSVADGGCSGFSYKLSFDKEQKAEDIVVESDGVKVYVDPKSAAFLQGIVIDFVSGLYGGGFKFTNPNATATCGCGTSFSA
jgi:iron-sulfur cluster assembly accessory protein